MVGLSYFLSMWKRATLLCQSNWLIGFLKKAHIGIKKKNLSNLWWSFIRHKHQHKLWCKHLFIKTRVFLFIPIYIFKGAHFKQSMRKVMNPEGNPKMLRCGGCSKSLRDVDASKRLRCSRCKAAYFCDRKCQRRAWPRHRTVCYDAEQATPEMHTSCSCIL